MAGPAEFHRQSGFISENKELFQGQQKERSWPRAAREHRRGSRNRTVSATFGRLDALRISDGQPATISVPMIEASQTGMLSLDVKTTRFAELASEVVPDGRISFVSGTVSAVPHGAQYPDEPLYSVRKLVSITTSVVSDVELALTYGQFLGAPWQEVRTSGFLVESLNFPDRVGYIAIREPLGPAKSRIWLQHLWPKRNLADAPRAPVDIQRRIARSAEFLRYCQNQSHSPCFKIRQLNARE